MLKALAGLIFAAILTPLGLRLVLPFIDLPAPVRAFEDLLVWWTDLLALPFDAVNAAGLIGGFLPGGGSGLLGELNVRILAALVGWTIVEGVVMAVLAFLQRR